MTSYHITIDLRGLSNSGSRALKRWTTLGHMLRDIIINSRKTEDAYWIVHELAPWATTSGWKIKEAPHWVLTLSTDEWQALSLGLRALGTPAGSSMYQWLNNNREREYSGLEEHIRGH